MSGAPNLTPEEASLLLEFQRTRQWPTYRSTAVAGYESINAKLRALADRTSPIKHIEPYEIHRGPESLAPRLNEIIDRVNQINEAKL